MKQSEQRILDSLNRSADFIDANGVVVGALASSAAYTQLRSAVTALNGLSNQQGVAALTMTGQAKLQGALTTDLKAHHMGPVATVARARLRGAPDYAAFTRSFSKLQGSTLVRAARAMATALVPHAAVLSDSGFPADAITQLEASATALESSMTDRASARSGRVYATKGIKNELRAGREALMMLHAVISRQFAADTSFMAAWNSARRITNKIGAVRTSAALPVPPTPQAAASPSPATSAVAA